MKLLNCPFCGGKAKVRSQGFNTNSIVCGSCHARTASYAGMGASTKWNARDCDGALKALRMTAVECPPGVDAVSFSRCMHAAFVAFELELKR